MSEDVAGSFSFDVPFQSVPRSERNFVVEGFVEAAALCAAA